MDATIKASIVTRGAPPPPSTEGAPGFVPQGNNNRGAATVKPDVKPGTPGCSKLSKTPSWVMSDFYNAGLGARFIITNQALNYTARCNLNDLSATSEGQLEERSWWNCSRYDTSRATYPYDGIYTEILYGGPQSVLGINQTWHCTDEDSSKPSVLLPVARKAWDGTNLNMQHRLLSLRRSQVCLQLYSNQDLREVGSRR